MAYTESMAMTATIFLAVMMLATAQAPSPLPTLVAVAPSPPISCTMPSSYMVSSNYCNSNDQSSMESQTQNCTAFLTDIDPTPSKACCTGFNEVAYNRTACICMATFYPSSNYNASRALDLPMLCSVQTNLCKSCPDFLITRSQGPAASQASTPAEGKSMASTIGAISLAVVFGLLLVAGIIGLTITLIKKRRARNNPPGPFEVAPPGGAF